MSNYGNRSSKMPDTSPTLRTDFTTKQAVVAFVLVLAIVAAGVACAYAFHNNREAELDAAITRANTKEAQFIEAAGQIAARETELNQKETLLAGREAAPNEAEADLQTRSTALGEQVAAFEAEKADYATRVQRIHNYSTLLNTELDALYPADEIVEYVNLDDEPTE